MVSGYPDGSFKPDSNITRAEFVSMAIKCFADASDTEYDGSFLDVSNSDWYAKYISKALNMGIISKDVYFRPNDNITREEICKIAVCLSGCEQSGGQLEYADSGSISEWAVPYVKAASENKIVNGYEDNTFRGGSLATRAEAAVILDRVKNLK